MCIPECMSVYSACAIMAESSRCCGSLKTEITDGFEPFLLPCLSYSLWRLKLWWYIILLGKYGKQYLSYNQNFIKINYLGFIFWDHRTKPLLRRVTISYQMLYHICAQRVSPLTLSAFAMLDGSWNLCLLTGWSSQCGWWWGKQQGLLCMMRWQSEQTTTTPPSSFELPEWCMGLPHLWKEERRQHHQ